MGTLMQHEIALKMRQYPLPVRQQELIARSFVAPSMQVELSDDRAFTVTTFDGIAEHLLTSNELIRQRWRPEWPENAEGHSFQPRTIGIELGEMGVVEMPHSHALVGFTD